MANIRKQFNFRNGVQVDDDNLIVSSSGLVGIGTSIPTEKLDVRGNAKVVGLATVDQLYTPNLTAVTASITDLTLSSSIIGSGVSIGSGIITAVTGVVTYYGDGGRLLNLPTSQWLDIDAGLGFTSIYAQGYVGVGTDDPRFLFQVGGNTNTTVSGFERGVGISSEGHILATGIATASKFVGVGSDLTGLNASSIAYGTISNDRIPVLLNSKMPSDISISGVVTATSFDGDVTGNVVGNVTGNLTGNVTGTANLAEGLTGVPNIVVGSVTANSIGSTSITSETVSTGANLTVGTHASVGTNLNVAGITTTGSLQVGVGGTAVVLDINGRIGIGSVTPSRSLQIIEEDLASIEAVGPEARILLGQELSGVSIASSTAEIRFGQVDKTFELANYSTGNFVSYIHASNGSSGIDTGSFRWVYGQTNVNLMALTYDGNLGVGLTNPSSKLHVAGTSRFEENSIFENDVTVQGTLNPTNIILPSVLEVNLFGSTGISTVNNLRVTNNVSIGNSVGISTLSPVVDLDARLSDALINRIGIGFTQYGVDGAEVNEIRATLHNTGRTILSGSVGIGTTNALVDLGTTNNPSSTFASRSGREALLKVYDGVVDVEGGELSLVNATFMADESSRIGVGTADPRSAVDFSRAGYFTPSRSGAFMILPRLTDSERIGLGTVEGAVIFNTTTKTFQGYDGTAWQDFH